MEEAVNQLLVEARIPRPLHWPDLFDALIKRNVAIAFVHALERLGPVSKCSGFDETKLFGFEIRDATRKLDAEKITAEEIVLWIRLNR